MTTSAGDAWNQHLHNETVSRDVFVDVERRNITFTYPGIPYWAFELHPRIPDLMSIVRVVEDSSRYGGSQPLPNQPHHHIDLWSKMVANGTPAFVQCFELKISRAMYDPAVPKWPLKCKISHGFHDGPRVTSVFEMKVPGSEENLVSRSNCQTYLNEKTRKVVDSLPLWFTDALDGKETLDKCLKVERLKTRPPKTYRRTLMVLFSDLDIFRHVNYGIYLKLCQDTLRLAITQKEFPQPCPVNQADRRIDCESTPLQKLFFPQHMSSAVMAQGVKTLRARYVKEIKGGENVWVNVWQEDDKPFWVFFIIEGANSLGNDIRFEMSLEYFSPRPNL